MANILNLNDDAVNKAMMDGLMNAFREELKAKLTPIAMDAVHSIVSSISDRMEIKMRSMLEHDYTGLGLHQKIDLTWIFKKEKET